MSVASTEYWDELSKRPLTEDEVRLYKEHLNWRYISQARSYSPAFWSEMVDYIEFEKISANPNIPYSFLTTHESELRWNAISGHFPFTREQVVHHFSKLSTLNLYYHNPNTASLFTESEWRVMRDNHSVFFEKKTELEKREKIKHHLLNQETILTYLEEKERIPGGLVTYLSAYHALDYETCKRFASQIQNRYIERKNRLHTLSEEEIIRLREDVTTAFEYERHAKRDDHWQFSVRKYVFTREYIELHKHEMDERDYEFAIRPYESIR